MTARTAWTPDRGWHQCDQRVRLTVVNGRIRWVPVPASQLATCTCCLTEMLSKEN